MSAERIKNDPPAPLRLAAAHADAAGEWLRVLEKLLSTSMPATEAAAVVEELESHLRERVRDLEVAGAAEDDAVRQALSELGDAASLARRYREARLYPRRRLLMNLSMLAVSGAILATGVVMVSRPGDNSVVSVFQPPQATATETEAIAKRFNARYENVTLNSVFNHVADAVGLPVSVAWTAFEQQGTNQETPVSLQEQDADLGTLFRSISDQLSPNGEWRLAFRLENDRLRIATDEFFDRREMLMASYDLSSCQNATGEDISLLIKNFVCAPGWIDNGGNMAKLSQVGSKLFVEAPRRYHAEIEWIVNELRENTDQAAAADNAALADLHRRMVDEKMRSDEAMAKSLDAERRMNEEKSKVLVDQRAAEMQARVDLLIAEKRKLQDELGVMRDNMTKVRADHRTDEMQARLDQVMAENKKLQSMLIDAQTRLEELAKRRSADDAQKEPSTRVTPLKYIPAEEAARVLRSLLDAEQGGAVAADARTNSVIVSGDRNTVRLAEWVIQRIDEKSVAAEPGDQPAPSGK